MVCVSVFIACEEMPPRISMCKGQLFSCTDWMLCGTSIQSVLHTHFLQWDTRTESLQLQMAAIATYSCGIWYVTNCAKTKTRKFNILPFCLFRSLSSLHACIYSAELRVIRFLLVNFSFFSHSLLCRLCLCVCKSLYCSAIEVFHTWSARATDSSFMWWTKVNLHF